MERNNQKGFTILELMIAVSVFSVAILIITTGSIAVARYYQQGATKAKLLTASREMHSQITQTIQYSSAGSLSAGTTTYQGKSYYFNCIGNTRYLLSSESNQNDLKFGDFMTEDITNDGCSGPITSPQHPLPKDTVVTIFRITGSNPYTISTRFILGDKDMFTGTKNGTAGDYTKSCHSNIIGREFCSEVSFESTVARKVAN